MTEPINIGVSTNWAFRWGFDIPHQQGTFPNSHIPIGVLELPLQLESNLVAVRVNSDTAKGHWNFAGVAIQKVFTGIQSLPTPDAEAAYTKKIYLRRLQLLFFEKLSTTYSLSFRIPYWISAIEIDVYEYIGEGANFVKDSLVNIEQKLDQLL